MAFLRELEKEDPDDFSILSAQVNLLTSQERYEEALAISERLESLSSDKRSIAFCKANCHAGLENFELSEKYEKEALESSVGMVRTASFYFQHIRRIQRGQFLKGEKFWGESWKSYPGDRGLENVGNLNHSILAIEYASNLFQQGRETEALEALELFRHRLDVQGVPQFWIGFFLVKSGDVAEAEVVLQELRKKAVRYESVPYMNSNIVLLEALIQYSKGELDQARENLESLSDIPILNRRIGVEKNWLHF